MVTSRSFSYYLNAWDWSICWLHMSFPTGEFVVAKKLGILLTFVDSILISISSEGTHEKLHEFENRHQEKENGGSI